MNNQFFRGVFIGSLLYLSGCGLNKPSLLETAAVNPEQIIVKQDSLLQVSPDDPQVIRALTQAHVVIAEKSSDQGDVDAALMVFNKSLSNNPQNVTARYGKLLVEGHRFYRQGSRSRLWDAIEKYAKAAQLAPDRGEPVYWMAKAYEKKDDDDYELILETYDKALALPLPENLREDAVAKRAAVLHRKEVFENFWK